MRRPTTLLLLLACAGIALGALSATGLTPVIECGGGGVKEDEGDNVFVVVVDDEATTTTSAPSTPLSSNDVDLFSLPRGDNPLQVAEIDIVLVEEEDAKEPPFSWNDVKLSFPRGEDPLDKKKKKKHETCPVADLAAQCPPHKADVHYQNYTMRTYYGGKERRREKETEREFLFFRFVLLRKKSLTFKKKCQKPLFSF
jgi:hypothetical protein